MNLEVANRLQQLRKAKGLSQEELAQILGLSRQAISKWERAETSPDTDNLICLARLYNISIDKLLDTSESTEEIKERIAQERIDEIKREKEDFNNYSDDKNNDAEFINAEYKEEDATIIADEEIFFSKEQEESKETKDKIVNTMYSSAFVLGAVTWIIISEIDAHSWQWGWVFGAIAFCIVFSLDQMLSGKTLYISGIGLSLLFFCVAFGVCAEEESVVNKVLLCIAISLLALQVLFQMILYLIYFTKNRKIASEIFYKEQLIEIKHEYEKKIEKMKNRMH